MKKFEFKFQKLLDLREHEEQDKQLIFSGELAKLIKIDTIIEECKSKKQNLFKQSYQLIEKGEIAYLAYRDHIVYALENRMKEQNIKRKEQQIMVDKAREEYMEASKKKKIMEKLKERAESRYLAEIEKHEQDEIDEMATSTFIRQKRGDFAGLISQEIIY